MPSQSEVGLRRKSVTVLFADVADWTPVVGRLDPETVREVMSTFFSRVSAAIERHGGTIEKYIGDAVMAVFGIPTVHEDDALRAVRAASEIRQALAAFNDEVEQAHGTHLAVRIAVNTGEVVAGDPAAGHALATGAAIVVAKRLEEAGWPGDILIGATTRRLVKDAVLVEPAQLRPITGLHGPTEAFRLLAVLPERGAHVRRTAVPFVGRGDERALLEMTFGLTTSKLVRHLFTILGPAGVGKTRLVDEFLQEHSGRATIMRGRCLSYGEGVTYWPVAEAIRAAGGLDGTESRELLRKKLAGVLGTDQDSVRVADSLGMLIGPAAQAVDAEQTAWAVRRFLEALARTKPVIALFEDLQWAEPMFLALLEHVIDWARESPIFILCTARPEFLDSRPDWSGGKPGATIVTLRPLERADSEMLVTSVLGGPAPAAVRAFVAEAADGNPLFVEELLVMLVEEGALVQRAEGWELTADLRALPMPPTIRQLLAARLERLPEPEQVVLERAAIEGRQFHRGALTELLPESVRVNLEAHLVALLRRQLIRPTPPTLAGEEAFRFHHALLRDAAYDATPKRLRAELHERFARWLEQTADGYEEIVGYHLEQAHRLRADLGVMEVALALEAADRLGTAGRRAFARADMPAAANLLERAVALLPTDDARLLGVLPELASSLRETLRFGDAESIIDQALATAERTGDDALRAHALLSRLDLHVLAEPEGWVDRARAEAARLVPVFERAGDDRGLARAWFLLAQTHWMHCEYEPAGRLARRAAAHASRVGDGRLETEAISTANAAALFGPTPVETVIRQCEQTLKETRGPPSLKATTLLQLGVLNAMHERFVEARRLLAEASAVGVRSTAFSASNAEAAARVELLAGDLARAESEERPAYEALKATGERSWRATHAATLGEIVYEQGRYDEAESLMKESEEVAASDDAAAQICWRRLHAKILARRGDFASAQASAAEALERANATDAIYLQADSLVDLGEVRWIAHRKADARAPLAAAVALYRRKGNFAAARRTESLVERVAADTWS